MEQNFLSCLFETKVFILNNIHNEHNDFFLRTVTLMVRFNQGYVAKEFLVNIESFIESNNDFIFCSIEEQIFTIYKDKTVYAPGIENLTAYELKKVKKKKDLFEACLFDPYFEFFFRLKYDSLLMEEINIDPRFLKIFGNKHLINGIGYSNKTDKEYFFTVYNRKNNWILTLK